MKAAVEADRGREPWSRSPGGSRLQDFGKDVLQLSLLGVIVVFMGCGPSMKGGIAPNVLFILVDDLGWADLGCYGSRFYETPHIDRLAAAGTRFTDAYSASPVCSPTRASIMAGVHPARVRITDWIPGQDPQDRLLLGPRDRDHLPLNEITLAEALRSRGYRTFFAGKWHLGGEGHYPEDQGFEINRGGHEKGSPPGGYYSPYENPKLSDGPEGEYLPDRLVDESIRFLESAQGQPFLLFLSFYTVHTPIQASRRHIDYFRNKGETSTVPDRSLFLPEHDGWTRQIQSDPEYASMIYAMDENVGRLLAKLDDLQLAEETLVIFTSDNGGLSTLGREGAPTSNRPLRAGKGWCYEGGIRVPLIIRMPGEVPSGVVRNVPVVSTDLYPTVLDFAGLEVSLGGASDGESLQALVTGGAPLGTRDLYWHFPHYHGSTWKPGGAIRSGSRKLIEFFDPPSVELYDLSSDLEERKDLSQILPATREQLLFQLRRWRGAIDAQMPRPNPDRERLER